MTLPLPLILASQSPSRVMMLKQLNIYPDQIYPAHIDETETKKELPLAHAKRMALAKLAAVIPNFSNAIILSADTVSAVGCRILHKAEDDQTIRQYLKLISGRRHKVYSSVAAAKIIDGINVKQIQKTALSVVKVKRLTDDEIEDMVRSKEGIGKSGGCTVQGMFSGFIPWMSGTYSNIIGLPLFETKNILSAMGLFNKNGD